MASARSEKGTVRLIVPKHKMEPQRGSKGSRVQILTPDEATKLAKQLNNSANIAEEFLTGDVDAHVQINVTLSAKAQEWRKNLVPAKNSDHARDIAQQFFEDRLDVDGVPSWLDVCDFDVTVLRVAKEGE